MRAFAMVGGVVGFLLGCALSVLLIAKDMAPVGVALLCPVVGAVAISSATMWITNAAGAAGSTLYSPSGKTTPPRKEYSQAEAMVAQGRYEDGITAFELAISEDARDPTPYLRIARVYRDHLARHEDAVRWFGRALREPPMPNEMALLALMELVELHRDKLGRPEGALPELARVAEKLEGTDQGAWAARELARIKSAMPKRRRKDYPGSTP